MSTSVSTRQLFISCPLKYRLHSITGLRKIEDESAEHHIRFGSAFHAALEVIYRGFAAIQNSEAVLKEAGLTLKVPELKDTLIGKAQAAFLWNYSRQLDASDNAKTQESGLAA